MAIQEGIAYWASVTTPNTKFEPVYTVDLVVEDSVADDFETRGFKIKSIELSIIFNHLIQIFIYLISKK